MRSHITIVYNEPRPSRYDAFGEGQAVLSVLHSVEAVSRALLELGYQVTPVPLAPLEPVREKLGDLKLGDLKADLVFNLFEGFCGYPDTEALVPEILSELGIPYTGCPGAVLRLALDKARVKIILKAAGIDTPNFQLLSPETLHTFRLDYPCIIKPCGEDASHGLSEGSVVNDFAALKKQVEVISNSYSGGALVEEFIDGREFNVTILGNSERTVLPFSEITYLLPPGMPRILTFAAKWEPDSLYFQGTKVICPARIGVKDQKRFTEMTVAVFRLLSCRGYARVDMRLSAAGRLNVIEVNPNPDISPGSGAVLQAEAAGMSYTKFIENIVLLALEGK